MKPLKNETEAITLAEIVLNRIRRETGRQISEKEISEILNAISISLHLSRPCHEVVRNHLANAYL